MTFKTAILYFRSETDSFEFLSRIYFLLAMSKNWDIDHNVL